MEIARNKSILNQATLKTIILSTDRLSILKLDITPQHFEETGTKNKTKTKNADGPVEFVRLAEQRVERLAQSLPVGRRR